MDLDLNTLSSDNVDDDDIFFNLSGSKKEFIQYTADKNEVTFKSDPSRFHLWRSVLRYRYFALKEKCIDIKWTDYYYCTETRSLKPLPDQPKYTDTFPHITIQKLPECLQQTTLRLRKEIDGATRLLVIHMYNTTQNFLVQGSACNKWVLYEFLILGKVVDILENEKGLVSRYAHKEINFRALPTLSPTDEKMFDQVEENNTDKQMQSETVLGTQINELGTQINEQEAIQVYNAKIKDPPSQSNYEELHLVKHQTIQPKEIAHKLDLDEDLTEQVNKQRTESRSDGIITNQHYTEKDHTKHDEQFEHNKNNLLDHQQGDKGSQSNNAQMTCTETLDKQKELVKIDDPLDVNKSEFGQSNTLKFSTEHQLKDKENNSIAESGTKESSVAQLNDMDNDEYNANGLRKHNEQKVELKDLTQHRLRDKEKDTLNVTKSKKMNLLENKCDENNLQENKCNNMIVNTEITNYKPDYMLDKDQIRMNSPIQSMKSSINEHLENVNKVLHTINLKTKQSDNSDKDIFKGDLNSQCKIIKIDENEKDKTTQTDLLHEKEIKIVLSNDITSQTQHKQLKSPEDNQKDPEQLVKLLSASSVESINFSNVKSNILQSTVRSPTVTSNVTGMNEAHLNYIELQDKCHTSSKTLPTMPNLNELSPNRTNDHKTNSFDPSKSDNVETLKKMVFSLQIQMCELTETCTKLHKKVDQILQRPDLYRSDPMIPNYHPQTQVDKSISTQDDLQIPVEPSGMTKLKAKSTDNFENSKITSTNTNKKKENCDVDHNKRKESTMKETKVTSSYADAVSKTTSIASVTATIRKSNDKDNLHNKRKTNHENAKHEKPYDEVSEGSFDTFSVPSDDDDVHFGTFFRANKSLPQRHSLRQQPITPPKMNLKLPDTCSNVLLGDSNMRNIVRKKLDKTGKTEIRTFRGCNIESLTNIIDESSHTYPSVRRAERQFV